MILVKQAAPATCQFKHFHCPVILQLSKGISLSVSIRPNRAKIASVAPYNWKKMSHSISPLRLQTMERFFTSVVVQFDIFIVALCGKIPRIRSE
jgi:hypothetical protein